MAPASATEPPAPRFAAHFEGSLTFLTARLEAVQGTRRTWLRSRDRSSPQSPEQTAIGKLRAAGFSDGRDDLFELRGELRMPLPVGLVYDPAGRIVLDPDSGVQQAIRHVFTLFARTGSARATVQQFNADGLLFPVRVRTGTHKGELAWMPLQHWRCWIPCASRQRRGLGQMNGSR